MNCMSRLNLLTRPLDVSSWYAMNRKHMTQTEQVSSRVEEKYNGEEKTSVAGRLRFHASTPETSCDFTGSTLDIAFCHRMRLHGRLGFTKQILAFGRRYRKGPFTTGELHLVRDELFAIFC